MVYYIIDRIRRSIMAHKTFISYKYSESQDLRDKIIKKLGTDAIYYKGETSESPNLTDYKTSTIRKNLSDMIYDTTVMIVIVSPNMKQSDWMEWEIKYALRDQTRNGRISHADGVICVVKKNELYEKIGLDPYMWAKSYDGHLDTSKLFSIINKNRNNKKSWDESDLTNIFEYRNLPLHYVDIVTEDDFLDDPNYYIDEAFNKSQNLGSYNLAKQ